MPVPPSLHPNHIPSTPPLFERDHRTDAQVTNDLLRDILDELRDLRLEVSSLRRGREEERLEDFGG